MTLEQKFWLVTITTLAIFLGMIVQQALHVF